jgi:hypothetical protein
MLFLIVVCGSVCGQRSQSPQAHVSVMVFNRASQLVERCVEVSRFSDSLYGTEESGKFVGCEGRRIPFGNYFVQFTSESFGPSRQYSCAVDAPDSVCLLMPDTGDTFRANPLSTEIRGVKATDHVVTIFRAVFSPEHGSWGPWYREATPASKRRMTVDTEFLDLVATVVVNGRVVGAAAINRRLSLKEYILLVDMKNASVSAKPGAQR